MKRILVAAVSLLTTFSLGAQPPPEVSPVPAAPVEARIRGDLEIPNLRFVKDRIIEFHDSGRYDQEIRQVTARARAYLDERLPRLGGEKVAVILDIDETALSNYPHLKECDFGYLPSAWTAWVLDGQAPAIAGTLELYRYARQKGVAVIFLTGRTEKEREATERNLRSVGFQDFERLLMQERRSPDIPTGLFKVRQRRALVEAGYRILVNLGDQDGDLEGGYSEAVYKLPNPMYYVP